MGTPHRLRVLMTCVLAGALVLSCKGPEDEELILGSSSGGSTTVTPGVVNDNLGFTIQIASDTNSLYGYTIHKGDLTFSEPCRISSSTTTNEDILCYVEAEELDLYYHGIKFALNIPTTMCGYALRRPYYYYSHQPGKGDTSVEVQIPYGSAAYQSTPWAGQGGAPGASTPNGNVSLTNTTPVCAYDYTAYGGPNCCEGTYELRVHTQAADLTWSTAVTTGVDWGGKASNCLEGPAMAIGKFGNDGHPFVGIYYTGGTGVSDEYEVPGKVGTLYTSNIHAANYFNTAEHGGNVPTAMRAQTTGGLSGTGSSRGTEPYYKFECYDRAEELIHRIRVLIREWNNQGEFLDSGNVVAGDWDTAPVDPIGGASGNDYNDWNDFENGGLTTSPFPAGVSGGTYYDYR